MPTLPPLFIDQVKDQLPDEWGDLVQSLEEPSPISVNYNTKKQSNALFAGDPIPWNPQGQYLEKRPSFTLDPHFQAGRYYVQEAGSMFIAYVLDQIQKDKKFQTALDLCAAPGGKTTLLLNQLPDDCLVVANEVIKSRYQVLKENLAKWGRANIIATNADSKYFGPLEGRFDVVLVDAPCSGEGLFRKTPDARKEWSRENVQLCQSRQKRILSNALPLLSDGGFLIYSTCTYNFAENDHNVNWIINQGAFETVQLDIPAAWGIHQTRHGYQFYPHRTRSEGFYISILRKTDGSNRHKKIPSLKYYQPLSKKESTLPSQWLKDAEAFQLYANPKQELFFLPTIAKDLFALLSQTLPKVDPGTPMGIVKGKDLVPAHELALSIHLQEGIHQWKVNTVDAINYMRKTDQKPPSSLVKGWHLVSFDGAGLGWVKVLPNRMNNYFPKHLRIRK